ncbi:MAG: hypothetical protein A3B90_00975 [Candidatus Magasanikbacteria bacterium RIFCSPHIGHO2_02_FULL_41_13]|uniref:Major facilitator superfamily (MFS) profile domain-containing protein n=1 Tax=Candidatus Magasanikbacteria bacterium RIFCSPHIGHO2_02_FULL_41_13 TaxID=1798676 RepID=A0A1F6M4L9_9BACT|nr:MAG: hypothetical protein A3B90_00975 [Candidatus Magasanikbacteria bacterium RIFCSPHIGHO2_02_FULL_41_13]
MTNIFKNKFRVWWLQVAYTLINSGFLSLLYLYFVKNHLNFGYIILAEALGYLATLVFILIKRQFRTRYDLRFGFILVFCALLLLMLPFSALVLLIPYTILKITGAIMFFVPYNILFFETTNLDKKLSRMTSYWSIGLVVGIFAPLLGGFLFSQLGLLFFIFIATVLVFAAFFLTYLVKKDSYPYTAKEICTHIKGFRTIVMIDGALPVASGLLLTLYLLTFVRGAFDFGLLLSFIALLSVSFSFLLAKISDKNKKRLEFIWPLSTLSGIIMILFYFVHSFWAVIVLIICFKFISTMLSPIQSNIIFDRENTSATTWISRELFLNIGRFFVLLFLVPFLYFGFLKEAFVIVALLYILFPFVVFKKGVYKKYK